MAPGTAFWPMPRPRATRLGTWSGRCKRGQHGSEGSPTRRRREKQPIRAGSKKGLLKPEENEALGRSRGGFSTKVHLACDGKAPPLSVVVTCAERHSSTRSLSDFSTACG